MYFSRESKANFAGVCKQVYCVMFGIGLGIVCPHFGECFIEGIEMFLPDGMLLLLLRNWVGSFEMLMSLRVPIEKRGF